MGLDVSLVNEKGEELYDANITHNLNKMADAAGIYYHLWRPEEIGISQAKELVHPLTAALERLKANAEHYSKYNASNGWGLYENFVPFVERYLHACKEYPDAVIEISR